MDPPQLIASKNGKIQLYINKSTKDKFYLQCTHKKPTQCKARAIVKGELEQGKFEVLNHDIQKHQHHKCPTDLLLKNFHTQFKKNCLDKIETPVQQVYEDLKISFTSSLSPLEKSSFLSKLPPPKGSLMYNKLNASRIFQHMQIRSTSERDRERQRESVQSAN